MHVSCRSCGLRCWPLCRQALLPWRVYKPWNRVSNSWLMNCTRSVLPLPLHLPMLLPLPCPALPCPALPCPALLQCHCLGHLLQSAHTSLLMYLACCMFALYNRMCVRVCVYKRAVARDVNRSVGARACVVQAEGQCRAGQLLAGLGLDISLPGIRAATPAAAKDLLTVLLTKLADTIPPLSESRSAHYFCSATLLSH